jgi:translation elongation factor EF-1alpha
MTTPTTSTSKKICFVGSVDSGKSTCAGHLLYKCGCLTQKQIKELGDGSQKWSRVLDIFEEEQVRGKTHEFNIIPFEHKGIKYELIDTPGHQIYIRSMIDGISQFNPNEIIACVVISSSGDEFKSGWCNGTTKEDILLARGVGITNFMILVNKMDSHEWSEVVFNEIRSKVKAFLKPHRCTTIQFLAVSGYGGIGFTDSVGLPQWCGGVTLMGEIEKVEMKPTKLSSKFVFPTKWNRMCVQVSVINLQNTIVASGYECILHYEANEYPIVVLKIRKADFLRDNESGLLMIEVQGKPFETIRQSRNIILRRCANTVGFGIIKAIRN